MIEDGLFLGLGFGIATLIAIACLPLVWSRALRHTRERLARLLPSSQAEVDAVHDGLRAQAAVSQRRLEQRVEAEQRTSAQVKTDLGLRTVSLVAAEKAGETLRAERGVLLAELAETARDRRDGEGQRFALEKALHDADTHADAANSAAADALLRLKQATSVIDDQHAGMAALEARVIRLVADIEEGRDRLAAVEAVAAQHAKAELAVEAAFELKRTEAERLKTSLAILQEASERERQKGEERDGRLQQRSDALAAAETRMAEQDVLIKQRHAELAALKSQIEALEDKLKAHAERPGSAFQDDRQDDALRGEIVAVGDDALRLLRPESGRLEPTGAPETLRAGEGEP